MKFYIGEFLKEYGSLFFKYLNAFIELHPHKKSEFKIRFIGNILINKKAINEIDLPKVIKELILFEDHLTQKELYKRIKASTAVLLIPGYNSHWWTNFAKMVDYIALQKHVLAIVPNPSEARKELTNANLGLFLDSEAQALEYFLNLFNNDKLKPNDLYCKNYLASNQIKSFIKIFNQLD